MRSWIRLGSILKEDKRKEAGIFSLAQAVKKPEQVGYFLLISL